MLRETDPNNGSICFDGQLLAVAEDSSVSDDAEALEAFILNAYSKGCGPALAHASQEQWHLAFTVRPLETHFTSKRALKGFKIDYLHIVLMYQAAIGPMKAHMHAPLILWHLPILYTSLLCFT